MSRKFSEMYRQYCEAVEGSIGEKVRRPLSEEEKWGIWNDGSLLQLEMFERAVLAAPSPEEAAQIVSEQVGIAKKYFPKMIETLLHKVTALLQRPLADEEEGQLRAIAWVADAMHIIEQLIDTPQDQRDIVFYQLMTH
ncbi:hypothetical protein KDW_40490 [Dictyobacter vulcani]|uniref:Uncharacterized protein n=1 Tax=Dictyobacter vulcani TaxID=2607529 RepID=A0A5J4KTX9_9CHLR|nr:hypothetical protein [Dictyobacter vulcani]GER89887.1 hypothetical protein KDW_40490 [Dictyobacter vulcani]